MSNHTIDEEAFQGAYEASLATEMHEIRDDIMRQKSGTLAQKREIAEKTMLRGFLETYLSLEG